VSVSMERCVCVCVCVCGESERERERENERESERGKKSLDDERVYVVLLDAVTFGVLWSFLNLKTRLKSGVTFIHCHIAPVL